MEAASFLFQPETTEAELAVIGLTLDDVAEEHVAVWPDNWQTVNIFAAMQTQWRWSDNRRVGLDYNVLPEIWKRTGTRKKDRNDIFRGLRIMEHAAMEELNRQRKK